MRGALRTTPSQRGLGAPPLAYGAPMVDDAIQIDQATGLPVSSVDLLRRRLVNVVGHELRTPTTTIRGLAEALGEASDDAERRRLLDALVRSSRRLERLVEELLLASSITTALPLGLPAAVDLVALARAVWTAGGTPGPLEITGAASALAHEQSVRRALEQVLGNAERHGTAPFSMSAEEVAGRARLRITSAGPTLRPDELLLATEAFFRGEAAVTSAPGLGLGLAVARTLLEGQGGDIVLTSRDGGGVITTIELPVGS